MVMTHRLCITHSISHFGQFTSRAAGPATWGVLEFVNKAMFGSKVTISSMEGSRKVAAACFALVTSATMAPRALGESGAWEVALESPAVLVLLIRPSVSSVSFSEPMTSARSV